MIPQLLLALQAKERELLQSLTMNTATKTGKRNNRTKKGAATKGAKKDDAQSDHSWEDMLKAPLPKTAQDAMGKGQENDAKNVNQKTIANGDDWTDDGEATQATTTDSTKAVMGNQRNDAGKSDEAEDDVDRAGKKKRKKRANKRTVAKLKEIRKEFIERCVSPSYHQTNRLQLNGEITIVNHKKLTEQGEDAVYMNTRSRKGAKKKGPAPVKGLAQPNPLMIPSMPGMNMDFIHPGMVGDPYGMPMTDYWLPPGTTPAMQDWLMPGMEQGVQAMHPGMMPYNDAPDEKKLARPPKPESEAGSEGSDDEELKDYHIDGYHPVHCK